MTVAANDATPHDSVPFVQKPCIYSRSPLMLHTFHLIYLIYF
jgi:hypothetical protein